MEDANDLWFMIYEWIHVVILIWVYS
jgi:hypothetical protein